MIVVESELDDIQILDISLSHSTQVEPTPPSTVNQDLNSDDIFLTIASYQTTLSESWQEIYQVQTEISHSFAVACLCGSHNSEVNVSNLATAFDYSSSARLPMSASMHCMSIVAVVVTTKTASVKIVVG